METGWGPGAVLAEGLASWARDPGTRSSVALAPAAVAQTHIRVVSADYMHLTERCFQTQKGGVRGVCCGSTVGSPPEEGLLTSPPPHPIASAWLECQPRAHSYKISFSVLKVFICFF